MSAGRKKPSKVVEHEGRYLFSLTYTAELLHTLPGKVQQLVGAGVLDAVDIAQGTYLFEEQVTALRRAPDRLKEELQRQRNPRASTEPPAGSPPWPRSIFSDRQDQMVLGITDYRFKSPKDC